MKNSLKIGLLALAVAFSFAACKGKSGSSAADSTKAADSVRMADSAKMATDTAKKDTSKMKMAGDTTKKDTTKKK